MGGFVAGFVRAGQESCLAGFPCSTPGTKRSVSSMKLQTPGRVRCRQLRRATLQCFPAWMPVDAGDGCRLSGPL